MRVISEAASLPAWRGGIVVPTMGALHEGHASLIRRARAAAESAGGVTLPVVVTVFVNPTQFGDAADLARYPRTLEADTALCARAGADVVFAPGLEEVYPPGREVRVPRLPAVATEPGLEDAARPGHFAGVCQVVQRLFELTRPRAAVFGEKDWQQLQVVRAMAEQEGTGIEIVAAPTVREPDGLALSSRNRFLSAEERGRGLSLSRALREAGEYGAPTAAEGAMRRVLEGAGLRPDYAVVRDAASLLAPSAPGAGFSQVGERPLRALVAARVGSVRLIDNAPWPWRG